VIVKEALANGRLARRAPAPLADAARALATTPDALALAAVLAEPWADVVLSGAATVDQLISNLSAVQLPLDAATLASLDSLVEDPARYWSTRSALPWN
jgi:aryl-alcohol dehydrogenase-like predicted oxidoreductase